VLLIDNRVCSRFHRKKGMFKMVDGHPLLFNSHIGYRINPERIEEALRLGSESS